MFFFFFLRLNLINKQVITSDSVYFRHCCLIVFFFLTIVRISPEAIRITSISPQSSTMLMGRQSLASQMVTFSRTSLVIFLEKLWSMGWRSSNLGLLSVGCFALR